MHDNLDLLSLLNILDSTDNVIGEKLILKEKVENSKKEKLKGETGDMDPKKLRNYKVEQEVRTDSINKNTENKDKVKVLQIKIIFKVKVLPVKIMLKLKVLQIKIIFKVKVLQMTRIKVKIQNLKWKTVSWKQNS